jgi:hypothetical protein
MGSMFSTEDSKAYLPPLRKLKQAILSDKNRCMSKFHKPMPNEHFHLFPLITVGCQAHQRKPVKSPRNKNKTKELMHL